MAKKTSNFRYENTLKGFVERLTTALGDDEPGNENCTYSKEYLAALICDAFVMLANVQTDLFPIQEVEFDIESNTCLQRFPEECEDVVSFAHILDADGRCVPVVDTEYKDIRRYATFPANCAGCKGGVMSTIPTYRIGVSPQSDRIFAIDPIPPPGVKIRGVVFCRNISSLVGEDGENPLPEKLRAFAVMIEFLVLSLATSKDDPVVAAQHYNAFLQLANFTTQQQIRMQEQINEQ